MTIRLKLLSSNLSNTAAGFGCFHQLQKFFMLPLWAVVFLSLTAARQAQATDAWPELKWEALVPKDWDPAKDFNALNLAGLQDSDPRANEALEKLRQAWDKAPTEPSVSGRKIRIAGFALPLDVQAKKVTEFLIVPYFGACIHSPPPPANQIIHAQSAKPLSGIKVMEPIWAYGTLHLERNQSHWGTSGYKLSIDKISAYKQ